MSHPPQEKFNGFLLPENTPGVFIEHFDLGPPSVTNDSIVYAHLFRAAKQACLQQGWAFRSFSSIETPGVLEDFSQRKIKAFPTLILYSDGVELGRRMAIIGTVEEIIEWAGNLLASAGVVVPPPYVPDASLGCIPVTEDSEELGVEQLDEDELPEYVVVKTGLIDVVDHHMQTVQPLKIIYFGGKHPGLPRWITPLRYADELFGNRIIAYCLRDEMEKTFRLDRMHLPEPPLPDGRNDFRAIARCLNGSQMLHGMLLQIARLKKIPLETSLAAHFSDKGEFESFFDEYSYGGFILELKITADVIYLSIGFDANEYELMHYHFTPDPEPQLRPEIATHYRLYASGYYDSRCREDFDQ
jgi:hypothetical protein